MAVGQPRSKRLAGLRGALSMGYYILAQMRYIHEYETRLANDALFYCGPTRR